MGVRLIIDSTADLPKDIIEKYNIRMLPLTVHFQDEQYKDKEDISSEEFFEKLAESEELPTTSQIPPETFIHAFREEIEKGNQIIGIFLSSAASGTFQSANIAKEEFPDEDIILIDSMMLCMGMGLLVVTVAKMLEEGKNIKEVLERIEKLKGKIEHLFCVDTLKYLRKGGRIKASTAILGEVLNIKPILNVEDGLTQTIGKVRGSKKIIPYYIEHINNTMDRENTEVMSVCHSVQPELAKEMIKKIREEVNFQGEIIESELGPIIGTHAGPGVLAVFYIKK
ncbi:MAG: DegV family protein [Epulopiscium sp.]|nr:DegV family protein [Candidatus Epulonipiscium sp.]